MERNWFNKMLLAYTPVFFVVITVLFIIFFRTLHEQSEQEAQKINESLAGQAYRYVDQNLRTIDHKILRESLINENFQRFVEESDKSNVHVNLQAYKSLQELKISYPIIDSIYIVRYSDQSVLSLSTLTSIEEYGDKAFIQSYMEHHSSKWTDSRPFREFTNLREKNVVSLTRPVPFYAGAKGFIVVNVSEDAIRSGIQDMYDTDISFVRLIDKQGRDIVNGDEHNTDVEVLTSFTSDYTGWTLNSGLLEKSSIRTLVSMNTAWFVMAIVVAVSGILCIFYITKKSYGPLEQLVKKVHLYGKSHENFSFSGHKNEFLLIDHALDNMIKQSNQYSDNRKEDMKFRKKYIFEKLLRSTGVPPTWEEEMAKLNLSSDFYPSVVFIIEIDKYLSLQQQFELNELKRLKAAIDGAGLEINQEELLILWSDWYKDNRLTGILQIKQKVEQADVLTTQFFNNLKEYINSHSLATVTIGYSETVAIPEDLQKSYREAEKALDYKAVIGNNEIIRYSSINKNDEEEIYNHLKYVHEIVTSFRSNMEKWKEQYDLLFKQMEKTVVKKEEIINIMYFFIYQIEREVQMFPKESQQFWRETTLPQLIQELETFDTVDELKTKLYSFLEELAKEIHVLKQSRNYHQLMQDVRKYIEENYDNVDLSLEHLSNEFDITGKYLSKLFKEEFGEKFLDFLIGLRMTKAKELLENTEDNIVDISGQVGYTSANSFTRVFRKFYGVSPGEYRKRSVRSSKQTG